MVILLIYSHNGRLKHLGCLDPRGPKPVNSDWLSNAAPIFGNSKEGASSKLNASLEARNLKLKHRFIYTALTRARSPNNTTTPISIVGVTLV